MCCETERVVSTVSGLNRSWLDGTNNWGKYIKAGPCDTTTTQNAGPYRATFSDIRIGDIGTTTGPSPGNVGSSGPLSRGCNARCCRWFLCCVVFVLASVLSSATENQLYAKTEHLVLKHQVFYSCHVKRAHHCSANPERILSKLWHNWGVAGPSPPAPPSPSPPPPSGQHVCADPGSTPACNTCTACCHSFIPAGAECDKCVKENC